MEVVGAVSAVVGIVVAVTNLIDSFRTTKAYIDNIIDAPTLVEDLVFEVDHITYRLQNLQGHLQDRRIAQTIAQANSQRLIKEITKTSDELRATVQKVLATDAAEVPAEQNELDGTRIRVRRMKWLQVEPECRRLSKRLQGHSVKLDGVMLAVCAEYGRWSCSRYNGDPRIPPPYAAEMEDAMQQISLIGLELPTEEQDLAIVPVSPMLREGADHYPTLATSSAADPVALPVKQEGTVQAKVVAEAVETAIIQTMSGNICGCQCHSNTIGASQTRRIRSNIRFRNHLSVFANRCSNFECCAREARSKKTVLVSGRWLRKFIRTSAQARRLWFPYRPKERFEISEGSDANTYAKTGNLEGLRKLLRSRDVVPWAVTYDGWSLLHAAAYHGHFPVVDFLLKHGADADVIEDGKRKAADLARVRALIINSSDSQKQIANRFPDAEDFKDDAKLTPPHVALLSLYEHGDKARPSLAALLSFIEDADSEPTDTNWKTWRLEGQKKSPLFREIVYIYKKWAEQRRGLPQETPKLIDQKDEKYDWTPFLWAAYTGRTAELVELIDAGADPFITSKMGRNAIHLAAESKIPAAMEYILDIPPLGNQRLNIDLADKWKETPLHVAASESAGCVKLLLQKGANRSARQENDQVPLHYAVLAPEGPEKYEIVDLLSDGDDAPINALDEEGPEKYDIDIDDLLPEGDDAPINALDEAGPEKHDIVDLLSDGDDAPINALDEEGRSPLSRLLGAPDCVRLLMSRGADITLLDIKGKSALYHACVEDHAESLALLMDACSEDPALYSGLMPVALEHKSPCCAKLLLERDALGSFHGQNGWELVHYAAEMGDPDLLEAVLKHPTFRRKFKDVGWPVSGRLSGQNWDVET